MLARRDTGEKQAVTLDALEQTITATLEDIQRTMFEKAKERLHEKHHKPSQSKTSSKFLQKKTD